MQIKLNIPTLDIEIGQMPEALTGGSFIVVKAEVTLEFVRGGGVQRGSRGTGTQDSSRPDQQEEQEAECPKSQENAPDDLSGPEPEVEKAAEEKGDVEEGSNFHKGPGIQAEAIKTEDGHCLLKNSGNRQRQEIESQGANREERHTSLGPINNTICRPELDVYWSRSEAPLTIFCEEQPDDEEPESLPPRPAASEDHLEAAPPTSIHIEEPAQENLEQSEIPEEPTASLQTTDRVGEEVEYVMNALLSHVTFKEESDAYLAKSGRKRACSVLWHNRAKRSCRERSLPPVSMSDRSGDPTEAIELAHDPTAPEVIPQANFPFNGANDFAAVDQPEAADEFNELEPTEVNMANTEVASDRAEAEEDQPSSDDDTEPAAVVNVLNVTPPPPSASANRKMRSSLLMIAEKTPVIVARSLVNGLEFGIGREQVIIHLEVLLQWLRRAMTTLKYDLEDVMRMKRLLATLSRITKTARNYGAPLGFDKLKKLAQQIKNFLSKFE